MEIVELRFPYVRHLTALSNVQNSAGAEQSSVDIGGRSDRRAGEGVWT
jgi:hypothetical protein